MDPIFSLAPLTMLDLAPPPFIDVAARTGYQRVGVRLLPAAPGGVAYRLMDDAGLLQDTVARIRDTGVGVFELEMVRLDSGFRASDYLPFFEVGEKLGAKTILVAGDDADEARLTASYAALCEAAAPFGLAADIEFMPWTKIPDARSALRIVTAAAQPNGGVLVDALHVARSATSLADIAAIPPERLHYAQICDGPAEVPLSVEAMIHTARCERLLPGEGGIDLIGLFATLPADLPICVEIPNVKRAPVLGNEEWARQALAATKATLARIEARDRAR